MEKTPEERQQELRKIEDYKSLERSVSEKVDNFINLPFRQGN